MKKTKPSLTHVKVRFTYRQAVALAHAYGNSLDSDCDAQDIFNGDEDSISAAYEAADLMSAAMHAHRQHRAKAGKPALS